MNHTITPLFSIPLYQTNIGSTEHDCGIIESQKYLRMPADNGSYTENKNILDLSELAALKQKIQEHIDYFLHNILDCDHNLYFEIQNSWVNQHKKDDFAGIHRHSNSIISGVYYPLIKKDSGAIVFQKDKSYYNLWTDTIEIGFNYQNHGDQRKLNVYNSDAWGIQPKQGDLILFPSLLYHSVTENQTDDLRYSLAFNVFPKGKFGDSINHLEIR